MSVLTTQPPLYLNEAPTMGNDYIYFVLLHGELDESFTHKNEAAEYVAQLLDSGHLVVDIMVLKGRDLEIVTSVTFRD